MPGATLRKSGFTALVSASVSGRNPKLGSCTPAACRLNSGGTGVVSARAARSWCCSRRAGILRNASNTGMFAAGFTVSGWFSCTVFCGTDLSSLSCTSPILWTHSGRRLWTCGSEAEAEAGRSGISSGDVAVPAVGAGAGLSEVPAGGGYSPAAAAPMFGHSSPVPGAVPARRPCGFVVVKVGRPGWTLLNRPGGGTYTGPVGLIICEGGRPPG